MLDKKTAVAAAVGAAAGVAVVCLYNKYCKKPEIKKDREIKQSGYLWRRPSLVPKNVIKPKLAEEKGEAKKEGSFVYHGHPSDSSSHLASNHLSSWQDEPDSYEVWPPVNSSKRIKSPMSKARAGMNFLNSNEKIVGHIIMNDSKASSRSNALADGCIRANATEYIWWEPSKVKAAMVTCGGLCPGLNSIIRGVTHCLYNDYGVRDVVGITAGYNGLGGTPPPRARACPSRLALFARA
eukprot:5667885-Prymnesium_polylepis.2